MNKMILSLLICAFGVFFVLAQSTNQMVFKKGGVFLNDTVLSKENLKSLLTRNVETTAEYNKYKSNANAGSALMITGGCALVAAGVLTLANTLSTGGGSKTPLNVAIFGAGIYIIGVPFIVTANKHLKKSISIYNSKQTTGFNDQIKLNFGITQNGLGMICRF